MYTNHSKTHEVCEAKGWLRQWAADGDEVALMLRMYLEASPKG